MSRMSAGMGLMIPCALLLLTSGAVFADQVENGTLGGTVYFYESIPTQFNTLIQWIFKDDIIAQLIPGGDPLCIGNQYTGRCELSKSGTLRLDNLMFADEGSYTMTAQYPNSTIIKRSTYGLRVYTILNSPVLSINDTFNNLIGGTYVSLHCNAGGQTVTTYTFYRDGKNICSEPHVTCWDSNLYFQPITGSDIGSYTCTIQNPVSSNTSNTMHLDVSGPPEGHMACLVGSSSQYIQLTCSWQGGQPATTVTMVFNGLSETGTNQVTRNVAANTSLEGLTMMCYGDYFGRPSNCEQKFDLPESTGHNNSAISSVIDGQAAEMTVDLVSGFHSVFTWYYFTPELTPIQNTNKFTVISSSFTSSLLITAVSEEDAGKYECRAKNIVGSQSFLFTIDVTAPSSCPICHGLGGDEVAGIVIGVVAGITIIEVIVFFVLKTKKKPPLGSIYENSNVPPLHIYSTTIPGTELKPRQQESHYEQLTQPNRAIYNDLEPSTGKR